MVLGCGAIEENINIIITVLDCTNRYCNDLGWSVVRCEKPIEHRYILFSFNNNIFTVI